LLHVASNFAIALVRIASAYVRIFCVCSSNVSIDFAGFTFASFFFVDGFFFVASFFFVAAFFFTSFLPGRVRKKERERERDVYEYCRTMYCFDLE
jgi:hypothetical protein